MSTEKDGDNIKAMAFNVGLQNKKTLPRLRLH